MSGRENCYDKKSLQQQVLTGHQRNEDNGMLPPADDFALVESFFATLKIEEADAPYEIRQQAKTSIFRYIDTFYNSKRRHSSLTYLSPIDFERLYLAKVA